MGKYRKRPVIVEAMQLDASNGREVADWCGGEFQDKGDGRWRVKVPTMHGQISAYRGEWVVRGVVDFYPMPADQFAVSFDQVSDDEVLTIGLTRLLQGGHP